jgi:hypothetical protein
MAIEQPMFYDECECEPKYTLEPHGKAKVLYFGRCNHKHGYNLCTISEEAHNFVPEHFIELLNR